MQRTFTRGGVIYQDNGDGTATVVGYEGAQAAPEIIQFPTSAREQRKDDVTIANTQANTVRTKTDIERDRTKDARDWGAKVAEMADKGWMVGPDGASFVRNPDWVDPSQKKPPLSPEQRISIQREALQKLQVLERLRDRSKNGWFATGFGASTASNIAGTPASDQYADVDIVANAGALTRVMELAKENGGKNPLTPLSGEDFKAISKSVTNLDPSQSDANFQRNVDTYKDIYLRAYEAAGGKLKDGRPLDENGAVIPFNPKEMLVPGGPGGNGQPMQFAQSERYSTPEDIALAKAVQGAYNKGGSVRDMAAAASALGYRAVPQDVAQWSEAIKYRDNPGRKGPLPSVETRKSGVRDVLSQNFGNFAASPVGGFATGMANAWTLGALDEATGAINSAFTGRGYEAERDWANMGKQAQQEANGGSYLAGQFAGGLSQGLLGAQFLKAYPNAARLMQSAPGMIGGGAGYGAVSGALEDNADRLGGAGVGALGGAGGAALGRYALGPLADRVMRTSGGQAASQLARNALRRLPGGESRVAAQAQIPSFTRGENLIDVGPNQQQVRVNLEGAARLNLPYALADADPALRNAAGSAARISPDARVLAERTFDPRALGQAGRANDAIDQYLAPITDIEARGKDLLKAGNIASEPYYALARGRTAPTDREMLAMLETKSGRDALKRAYDIASDNGRSPTELGFVIDDSGNVVLPGMEGRFTKAQAAAAKAQLTPQTLRTWNGGEVRKNGPVDLVGWLRLNGGLRDNGGELAHMGLSNKMRPGVDLKGQENRFGPIVNNDGGMNLDDAAFRAWEEGYFPELTDRPDVNTFLNAVREGHDGLGSRFRAEDFPEVERFFAAQEEKANLDRLRSESGGQVFNDTAQDAGPRGFAPLEAYGQKEQPLPTFETLDLVKKGFDARINEARDPFGNLNLSGNPQLQAVEGLRQRFVSAIDRVNPDYPKARAEYQKYAKRKDALESGGNLFRGNVPQRTFDSELARASAYDNGFVQDGDKLVPEMQRGYATAMSDAVGRARLSANPYQSVYGGTDQQARVKALFPNSADFDRTYGLEQDMTKTRGELLGGSPTAARQQADASFMDSGMGQVLDVGAQIAATGGVVSPMTIARLAKQVVSDRVKIGLTQKVREEKANNVAGILFNTNPNWALNYLDDLTARRAQDALRQEAFARRGGLLGTAAAVPVMGAFGNH